MHSSCFRQLAITIGFMLGWYLLLDASIPLLFPENAATPIDTLVSNSTLTNDAPTIVVNEIDRLARPAARRMLLVGSSNTMFALRPEDVREHLPAWEIHSLAIPTSNVHQVAQVVETALATSDTATLRHTVFVLGTYFGLYASAEPLWNGKASPLEREMLRYGLYREVPGGTPRPWLGYGLSAVTKHLYRTLLGVHAVTGAMAENLELVVHGKPPRWNLFHGTFKPSHHFPKRPANAAKQRQHIKRRANQIGTRSSLPDEQFVMLAAMVKRIRAAGAKLVIVELPVARWVRGKHYKFYREHKQSFVAGLAVDPGVGYLDLVDVVPDTLMGDSTHMMRDGARLFAKAFRSGFRSLPEGAR